jgi:uncharacterized membrane protein HdeD (DUF308 family)
MTIDGQGDTGGRGTSRPWGGASAVTVDTQPASLAMSTLLARNWWAVALRAAFALLWGVIALLLPEATLGALVLLFSAYMLADGVLAILSAVRAARRGERWGLMVFEGVVDITAGVLAFFWPVITILTFVLLMAAWAIVTGVLMLSAAFRLTPSHGRWWMGFSGVVSVLWGVLLTIAPLTGAVVLTWWMGAYALVFGGTLLVLAFRLRQRAQGPVPAAAAA